MKRYRAILPVEIDGVAYAYGSVVELAAERAADYAHALTELEEGINGRDGEGL